MWIHRLFVNTTYLYLKFTCWGYVAYLFAFGCPLKAYRHDNYDGFLNDIQSNYSINTSTNNSDVYLSNSDLTTFTLHLMYSLSIHGYYYLYPLLFYTYMWYETRNRHNLAPPYFSRNWLYLTSNSRAQRANPSFGILVPAVMKGDIKFTNRHFTDNLSEK